MSFFADIKGERPGDNPMRPGIPSQLSKKAKKSKIRAFSILEKTIDNGFTPYYDRESHLKAFAAPFYSVAQLARNALRLTYSAVILFGALASFNGPSIANAFSNIGNILLASVIEVLNIACLIISLATRTLASIFNLGYIATQTASQNLTDPKPAAVRRRDNEALMAEETEEKTRKAIFTLV